MKKNPTVLRRKAGSTEVSVHKAPSSNKYKFLMDVGTHSKEEIVEMVQTVVNTFREMHEKGVDGDAMRCALNDADGEPCGFWIAGNTTPAGLPKRPIGVTTSLIVDTDGVPVSLEVLANYLTAIADHVAKAEPPGIMGKSDWGYFWFTWEE